MIVTRRLELMPVTVEVLDAMVAGDGAAADAALGVRFPDPFRLPPETADVLATFRVQVTKPTDFPPYLVVRAVNRAVLGSAGTSTPSEDGVVVLGYGIYPEHERQGYASEAARALVDARLADHRVRVVEATIPLGHVASERVATRAGLVATGRHLVDAERNVRVWAATRSGTS